MNSSVTWDSATSVMSSLCLEISPSRRSNGPSNTSRWTSKLPAPLPCPCSPPGAPSTAAITTRPPPRSRRGHKRGPVRAVRGVLAQPAGQQAGVDTGVHVGEQHRDRLAHQPAPVHVDAAGTQRDPGPLEIEQFVDRQVHRDLLGVSLPPARL